MDRTWRYVFLFAATIIVTVSVTSTILDPTYPEPSAIVLVGMESTRADHLGPCYGYERETAPNICALAEDGVLFEQAYATGPGTLMSLPSFFTARTPLEVGGESWEMQYHDPLTTFLEVLSGEGYTLRQVEDSQRLMEVRLLQGFNTSTTIHRFPEDDLQRPVYFFFDDDDAHAPYTPVARFNRWSNISSDVFHSDRIREWRAFVNATPRQSLIDLYDGEIREGDQRIGRFLERLRENERYEDALIVFFADHGEAFGEHGIMANHGGLPYEEVVRVPLVVKFPGNRFAGTRVEQPVSLVDVPHTLFDYLDIDVAFGSIGSSLMSAVRTAGWGPLEADPASDVVTAASPFGEWMIREGSYTLFLSPVADMCGEGAPAFGDVLNATGGPQDDTVPVRLYDLSRDRLQRENIAVERLGVVRRLGSELCRLFMAGERNPDWFVQTQLSGELRDRLRALGYLE